MEFLSGNSVQGTSAPQASASDGIDRYSRDAKSPRSRTGWVATSRPGESGQTTVVMAVFLATFLCGFIGFALDVQSLFQARRQLQVVADAAATAAAEESPATGGSSVTSAEQTAANAIAKLNGFDPAAATNPVVVTIHTTPTSGNYTTGTAGQYLEIVVSKPVPTFFSSVITHNLTMTVTARAVAAANQGAPACICLEGTSGTDLNLSNNAKLTPTGCGTYVDSSSSNAVTIVGGSTLGGTEIGSVSSNWDTGSNVNNGGTISAGTKVVQGLSSTCSPPVPAIPSYSASFCGADPLGSYGNGGSTYTVGPGSGNGTDQNGGTTICYNSLTVGSNNDAVTLNPGIYIINGGALHFLSGNGNRSNLGGNGVLFYLTGGASLTIDNGANVNLTAMASGTYAGILVFQDPGQTTAPVRAADTQPISIQGGSNVSFNGAIFAPTSNVTLGNGSGTSLTADMVANTLTMNGGGTLASTAANTFGTLNSTVAKVIE